MKPAQLEIWIKEQLGEDDRISDLVDQLLRTFRDPYEAHEWLEREEAALGGWSPIGLLKANNWQDVYDVLAEV